MRGVGEAQVATVRATTRTLDGLSAVIRTIDGTRFPTGISVSVFHIGALTNAPGITASLLLTSFGGMQTIGADGYYVASATLANNYPMQILMQSEGESKTLTLTLQVYDGVGLQLPSYRKFTLTGREPQVRALITALVFANGARVSAGVVSVDVSRGFAAGVWRFFERVAQMAKHGRISMLAGDAGFDDICGIFHHSRPACTRMAQLATTRFSLTLRLLPRVRPLQIPLFRR